ncbi:MAG: 30S ribosomal protein S6 [Candidatus Paceibacterota bacterium]
MANTDTNERTNFYEIGYLLAPTIPEGEVMAAEVDFHSKITSSGGDIQASESPEMRELSYEIEVKDEGEKHSFSSGQFGWVQFSLDPENLDAVESIFVKNEDVIRHLLVTVDKENIGVKPAQQETTKEE